MASDIEDLEDLIVNKLSRISGVFSIKSNLALKKISYKTVLPIDTTRPSRSDRVNPRRGMVAPRQGAKPLPSPQGQSIA
ncbi:hypothetical protein [Bradyrhizobium sp. 33ap4]|uniref:hypothetical protein n=1 Tax=Bradyrhizobium sp. 33ap4 TaxID=3061630 RepID=UPI00292DBFF8|nr:hypothetical protein [Bradyrhizobium sp. 33ap4]